MLKGRLFGRGPPACPGIVACASCVVGSSRVVFQRCEPNWPHHILFLRNLVQSGHALPSPARRKYRLWHTTGYLLRGIGYFYDLDVDVASGRSGEVPARGVFEGRSGGERVLSILCLLASTRPLSMISTIISFIAYYHDHHYSYFYNGYYYYHGAGPVQRGQC